MQKALSLNQLANKVKNTKQKKENEEKNLKL